MNLILHRLTYG